MESNPLNATLSENEQVVRTYQCTSLRQLFMKPSIGYLTITNKRVVYHSENKNVRSRNAIISEIPLNDVGGISTFIGQSFNILYFLLFSVVMYFVTISAASNLPEWMTGWVVSIILVLPYLVGFLFEKNIISKEIGEKIIQNLQSTPMETVLEKRDSSFFMPIFKVMFLIGLAFLAFNLSRGAGFQGLLQYPILLGAYFIIYVMVFGRNRTFGLFISSKTSGTSGIRVQGGFFRNGNLGESITANPAADAETIARDLGAIVLDIQQLGDLAVSKWAG